MRRLQALTMSRFAVRHRGDAQRQWRQCRYRRPEKIRAPASLWLIWVKAAQEKQAKFANSISPGRIAVSTIKWVITTAPEIFLLLSIALGTLLGRIRIHGFSIGATACTLIVAVMIGQLGTFVIPPVFKSIFFSLFVFTIGYKSGPEFFASLSLRTLTQVALALVVGDHRPRHRSRFRLYFHLDPGTASGLAAGSPHAIVDDRNGDGRAGTARSVRTMCCASSRRISRPAMPSPTSSVTS